MRELYGYRDGADWKFKAEEVERLAAVRPPVAPEAPPLRPIRPKKCC